MSRLQIPGMGMPPQGPPQIAVAAPLNDTQLVCLMAAQIRSQTSQMSPADAVAEAQEIMAEAIQTSDRVTALVLAKRNEQNTLNQLKALEEDRRLRP